MKAKPSPQQQRLASAACARKARRSYNTQHSIRICTLRIGTLYGHQGWDWISTAVAQTIKRIVQASHRLGAATSLHFAVPPLYGRRMSGAHPTGWTTPNCRH